MSDELEQALMGVALGNENDIARVAAYLRENEGHGPTAAQAIAQDYEGRKRYLRKVLEWSRQNPDIAHDDEAYQHAVQIDAALAKSYPTLSEDERLERAADITREALGAPEERDNPSAIAQIAAARTKQPIQDAQTRVQQRDEESERWSEGIEQLRQLRQPRINEAAQWSQERRDREPRAARAERMTEHPDPRSDGYYVHRSRGG